MARPSVVIALPTAEESRVTAELHEAGFGTVTVHHPDDLAALLAERRDIGVAILDGETDLGTSLEYWSLLHEDGRSIPALMVVSPQALERLSANVSAATIDDEYLTRPYSAESLRWRVEAMCIRSQAVDDGSGPVLQGAPIEADTWAQRGTIVAVFNPKGGVGKTTVATNLAAALVVRKGQKVILVDADTVTGHVATSLALSDIATLADAWVDAGDGGPRAGLEDVAAAHPSGLRVATLSTSPMDTTTLEPSRVAQSLEVSRRGVDFVIIDLHPSYSPLNQAVFQKADRILVPVTPDVPAIRAAVQLREIAGEMGLRDRLAMVVNRANSGVSVADMEKTVGMEALALIRSGGMLFVNAANEGRTIIDRYPREKIVEDFDALADRILGTQRRAPAKTGWRLFRRSGAAARA
jgi:pilus assembly protein CpaE